MGTTTFSYDWAKRQTSVDGPLATNDATFAYNLDGPASRGWSGSSSEPFTYDTTGNLSIGWTYAAGAYGQSDYTFDVSDHLIGLTSPMPRSRASTSTPWAASRRAAPAE